MQPASNTEHLQSVLRKYYNADVREWFQDLDVDALDISIGRQSLAQACKHDDSDSLLVTVARQLLFDSVKNRAVRLSIGTGETTLKESIQRKQHPKATLYFLEDSSDVDSGYSPVDGQISIRLMDQLPTTITPAIAQQLANKIRVGFMSGGGFVWRKGKTMVSYTDWEKGYQLQLLVRNETEGRRIVEQVLDLQNDTPDWTNLNIKENAEPSAAFPTIPETERIYGEIRRLPRRRPIADVRFQMAFLHIIGVPQPITLADRSGVYPNALAT